MKNYLFILIISSLTNCDTNKSQGQDIFEIKTVKPIIQQKGKLWGKLLKEDNIALVDSLYDKNSHYLPDGDSALHGIESIKAYWQASQPFLKDIQLSTETLEGTRELLYETGNGIALVLNEFGTIDTLKYKYVNVWKLDEENRYKVVIDTYNDIKP